MPVGDFGFWGRIQQGLSCALQLWPYPGGPFAARLMEFFPMVAFDWCLCPGWTAQHFVESRAADYLNWRNLASPP